MAKPDTDDGWFKMAYELDMALAFVKFRKAEQVLIAWIRNQQFGMNKASWVEVSPKYLSVVTGQDIANISNALTDLENDRFIERNGMQVRFLKDYDRWQRGGKPALSPVEKACSITAPERAKTLNSVGQTTNSQLVKRPTPVGQMTNSQLVKRPTPSYKENLSEKIEIERETREKKIPPFSDAEKSTPADRVAKAFRDASSNTLTHTQAELLASDLLTRFAEPLITACIGEAISSDVRPRAVRRWVVTALDDGWTEPNAKPTRARKPRDSPTWRERQEAARKDFLENWDPDKPE